jgi:hypothetical protein
MHRLLFCDAEQLRSFPCALRLSLGEPGSDPQVYFTRYSVTIHGPADHSTCSAKKGIRQNHNAYLLILSSPRILSFQSSLLSPITSTERQPAYRHRSSPVASPLVQPTPPPLATGAAPGPPRAVPVPKLHLSLSAAVHNIKATSPGFATELHHSTFLLLW